MNTFFHALAHRALPTMLILGAAVLSGCASVSGNDCDTVDWFAMGQQDGTEGRSLDYMASHQNACVSAATEGDLDAYQVGRQQGLANYCTADNGLDIARSGAPYAGVCPVELEGQFLTGFRLGRHLHRVDVEMANNRDKATEIRQALDSPDLANVERIEMRDELKLLEQDYGSLEVRKERLAWQIDFGQ